MIKFIYMTEKQKDELDLDSRDIAVEAVAGVLAVFPGLGSLISNIFKVAIPRLRADRFADCIRRTIERVDNLEDFKEKMCTTEGMDYIED